MTFGDSVKTCLSKYVDFKGRAKRSEYWWFWLFTFLVALVAALVAQALNEEMIAQLVGLAFFLPGLSVGVRRCHDTGNSGWWIICPIVNFVLMFIKSDEGPNEYGEEPED